MIVFKKMCTMKILYTHQTTSKSYKEERWFRPSAVCFRLEPLALVLRVSEGLPFIIGSANYHVC